jgi:hypothetical protein
VVTEIVGTQVVAVVPQTVAWWVVALDFTVAVVGCPHV